MLDVGTMFAGESEKVYSKLIFMIKFFVIVNNFILNI